MACLYVYMATQLLCHTVLLLAAGNVTEGTLLGAPLFERDTHEYIPTIVEFNEDG